MPHNAPPPTSPTTTRPSWKLLYLVAGIGSILFVVLLLTALAIDIVAPPPVHDGAATLEFIAQNKTSYIIEQTLWILPNLLAVIVFVALFVALAPLDRSLALLSMIVGGLSWALILAVPTTSRGALSLVYLSDRYAAASPGEREVYATAAEAIIAENNTPAIVGVLSALGILLISLAMLRGIVSRTIAWLGVATGTLGVVSETLRHAAPSFYWGYGVLLWVWFVAIGIALIRLAMRTPKREPREPAS